MTAGRRGKLHVLRVASGGTTGQAQGVAAHASFAFLFSLFFVIHVYSWPALICVISPYMFLPNACCRWPSCIVFVISDPTPLPSSPAMSQVSPARRQEGGGG